MQHPTLAAPDGWLWVPAGPTCDGCFTHEVLPLTVTKDEDGFWSVDLTDEDGADGFTFPEKYASHTLAIEWVMAYSPVDG